MSGFSNDQLRKLSGKLDGAHVQSRDIDGRKIDYIEGWFALSEANAIFGFANWDRETVQFEKLFERVRGDTVVCSYLARIRIRVRAGEQTVLREGSGCGTATAANAGEAHERAIKAAETDATKRALATFGNRFGLCLYDKDQSGREQRPVRPFRIFDPAGNLKICDLSAEGFCSALRKIIEASDAPEIEGLQKKNSDEIAKLRRLAPDLKSKSGDHFADILLRLLQSRRDNVAQPTISPPLPSASHTSVILAPSRIAPGPRVEKAALAIPSERRQRDKSHLRRIGSLPCLICQELPSHPHHLTFAQRRGMSLKVSDEFVVPLCAVHHNDLHRHQPEREWWRNTQIDPLPVARALWDQSCALRATPTDSISA